MSKETMEDSLNEPLMGREEKDILRPNPQRSLLRILIILQSITLCLLPGLYFLGYHNGSQRLPQLPTHGIHPGAAFG